MESLLSIERIAKNYHLSDLNLSKALNPMPYNKEELLKLPAEERAALAEELFSSLEDDAITATKDEVAFAEERLKQHQENPAEGLSLEDLKKLFSDKYGF